jgi:hypothetical protein
MGVSKFSFLLIFVTSLFLVPSVVKADPVSFQNVVAIQGSSRIDLASNPNVSLIGPEINFLVDITGATPANGINTLRVTFLEAGQLGVSELFRVPLFDGLPDDYSQLFKFTAKNPSIQGVPVILTVELLDGISKETLTSRQYEFRVAQPVPEPAAMSLMAIGLVSLYKRRKRRQR